MNLLKRIILPTLTIAIISALGYILYLNYLFTERPLGVTTVIKVPPKTHLKQLANRLQQHHLWLKPRLFVMLADVHGFRGKLRYGAYQIKPGMSVLDLLQNI